MIAEWVPGGDERLAEGVLSPPTTVWWCPIREPSVPCVLLAASCVPQHNKANPHCVRL